jgi:hypothetical protein
MQFGGFSRCINMFCLIFFLRKKYAGKWHCSSAFVEEECKLEKWLAQEPSASEKYLLSSSKPGMRRGLVAEPGCGVA